MQAPAKSAWIHENKYAKRKRSESSEQGHCSKSEDAELSANAKRAVSNSIPSDMCTTKPSAQSRPVWLEGGSAPNTTSAHSTENTVTSVRPAAGTIATSYATFKAPSLAEIESRVSDRSMPGRWTSKDVRATPATVIPGTNNLVKFHLAELSNFHLADRVQRSGDNSAPNESGHPFRGRPYDPRNLQKTLTKEVVLTGVVQTADEAAENPTGVVGQSAYNMNNERVSIAWESMHYLVTHLATRTQTVAARATLKKLPLKIPNGTKPRSGAPAPTKTPPRIIGGKTQLNDATVFTSTHPSGVHSDTPLTTTPISDTVYANMRTMLIDRAHMELCMISTQPPF